MKFLLTAVNAKYIHSNPAIYSLRKYAGEEMLTHIEIAEYTINNRLEDILADIYRRNPSVIAFSCYIWNWSMIQDIMVELHKLLPQLPIWLGGPEVSWDASEILESYPFVTGVMVGEGEATFKELMHFYVEEKGVLDEISGLVIRTGKTAQRELTNLSQLPFLYENLDQFHNRIIYYESSRGCPYRCSYCLSSIDKTVRLRDISVVKKEIQFFLDQKVAQVKFVDRTFNCNHDHDLAIWRYILEHDNGVTNFHFEIAADILNDEEIELLNQMRPGLVQLEIGVQSTNPATLKEIRRVMNISKLEEVVSKIRQGNNIHQHLDLIAGLPFEDYDSFRASFNQVYAMKPDQLQLGFLKVLKGSYMHEMAESYGICYNSKPPYEVLFTKWLPYEKMLRLKKIEEMVEIYYNSDQFTYTLPCLEQVFEAPFQMYEALADFYDRNGYFTASPARVYRYQILLNFALEYDLQRSDLYKELLTFDMYLRENLKSRPDFSKDLANFKMDIRGFYEKEAEERCYLPSYEGFDARQLVKMTHLEPFIYPVWVDAGTYEKMEKEKFVLFNYQDRNPLTYQAKTVVVNKEK